MTKTFLKTLCLSLLTLIASSAWAQVAKIGTTEYETFAAAVAAAKAGDCVEITAEGTYTIPGINNNITIKGAVEGVVFNCEGTGSIASVPNGATFENVTMTFGNASYHGFQHAGTINMNGCTLKGLFFSYGDMNFDGCKFYQTTTEYLMWLYAGDITFEDCECYANGKFFNVYNEENGAWKISVEGCKFYSTNSNKAVFNIKDTCGAKQLKYEVEIADNNICKDCTYSEGTWTTLETSNNYPAASTATDGKLYVASPLWQVDDRNISADEHYITVKENGKEVFKDGGPITSTPVAKIGDVEYASLEAAVSAAQKAESGVIELLPAYDRYPQAWVTDCKIEAPENMTSSYTFHAFNPNNDNNDNNDEELASQCDPQADPSTWPIRAQTIFGQVQDFLEWPADFEVSFDANMALNDFSIGGNYGSYGWIETDDLFADADSLAADTPMRLLGSVSMDWAKQFTYKYMMTEVFQFHCGITGKNMFKLAGKTFRVDLYMYDPYNENVKILVGTTKYTFPAVIIPEVEKETLVITTDEQQDIPEDKKEEVAKAVITALTQNSSVNNMTAEETKINDAVSGEGERRLKVELISAVVDAETITEQTTTTVKGATFEVKPVYVYEEGGVTKTDTVRNEDIIAPITFRLAVQKDIQDDCAKVWHQAVYYDENGKAKADSNSTEEYLGVFPIKTAANGEKYIQLSASKFSFYTYLTQSMEETTEITITTADDLVALAEYVNSGHTMKGKTIKLGADIDMTGVAMQPIGTETNKFSGTFDGQEHAIANLTMSLDHSGAGLFGYVFDATIKDLKLTNVNITNTGADYTGGIAGHGYANISGCTVKGTIQGVEQVGGVIGYLSCGSVKNCVVDVKVTATTSRAGGIAGKANVDSEYHINNNTIKCEVSSPDIYAGGIVGQIMATENNTYEIKDNEITEFTVSDGGNVIGNVRSGSFVTSLEANITGNKWNPAGGVASLTDGTNSLDIHNANKAPVAKIGETKYNSLAEAIAAVQDGTETTITMIEDVDIAHGISVPSGKNFTVDFDGHTYTLGGHGAGSANTKTNGFQLLEGSTITFKNGTINCSEANKDRTWTTGSSEPKGIAMLIQNYADLTLDGMTIDGTNVARNGAATRYVVSNNSGDVNFTGATTITAADGDFAFDVYKYGTYPVPTVTIADKNVTINGKIEATGGNIVISAGSFKVVVEEAWCATGFQPVTTPNSEGMYTVEKSPVAKIGETEYKTLADAIADVPADGTITLLADIACGEFEGTAISIPTSKNFTLDLAGYTISGTATNAGTSNLIKVNKDATLVINDTSTGHTGKITYSSTHPDPKWGYGTTTIVNDGGTLTVNGGRIENMTTNGASYAIDNSSNIGSASLTINGGTITCPDGDQAVRQFCNSTTLTNDVVVNDGTVIEAGGMWLQMPSGQADRKGTLTINGGTINGMLDFQSNNVENAYVVINGGTFNVSQLRVRNGAASEPFVTIKDGNFTITNIENQEETGVKALSLAGGTYNTDLTQSMAVVADGFQLVENNDGTFGVEKAPVAKINDVEYTSLADAIAAVQNGETITMIANEYNADGISVPSGKNFTVDFAGHTYTLGGDGAGSTNTKTSGFQLLQGSTITFKNGTINCDEENKNRTWTPGSTELKGIAMLIQNYADLTLDSMTIDGTNVARNGAATRYVLSNNSGEVHYTGTTSITAATGDKAFDACKYDTYPVPTVTIDDAKVTINGNIEAAGGKLVISAGTVNGTISTATGYTPGDIAISGGSFSEKVEAEYCATGFQPVTEVDAQGMYTVKVKDVVLKVYGYENKEDMREMRIHEFLAAQQTYPNAMAVVSSSYSEDVEGLDNVILDYVVGKGHHYECENFVIDDMADFWYSPVSFVAISGYYTRHNLTLYNSVCVPFEVNDTNAPVGAILMQYRYSDEQKSNVYFEKQTYITAGQGFLMQATPDNDWTVTFNKTPISNSIVSGAMTGSYVTKTIGAGYFKVNSDGDKFTKTDGNSGTYPFRSYLDLTGEVLGDGASVQSFNIIFNEEGTTGILGTNIQNEGTSVYDINGTKQNTLQRGVNVVRTQNGYKKVIK